MEIREAEMKEWFKDLLNQAPGACPDEEELADALVPRKGRHPPR